MAYKFISCFHKEIQEFIAEKQSLGYVYKESSRILRNFDMFLVENCRSTNYISKEILFAWATINANESNKTFRNRLMPIREFARFLNRRGIEAYVLPTDLVRSPLRYNPPHIFSETELTLLWKATEEYPINQRSKARHLVIQTIFKLIYCCGLRPPEARKLLTKDIDLYTGKIRIMQSKGPKDRIVIMSDDICDICRKYDEEMKQYFPNRQYFFPSRKGECYRKMWLSEIFRELLRSSGIVSQTGTSPRIYDLRHTFATHRLYQWMAEGKEVPAMIPFLSSYMGHALLSDTYYYIHFVPSQFEEMSDFPYSKFEHLLPEVSSNE